MEKNRGSLRQLDMHINSPVRVYFNNEPDDYPAHWHRKFELIMPVSERYVVLLDSEAYEILPGEVLIIPSGVVHEIFAPPQGERYIFMVDQEVVDGVEGLESLQHLFYPCVHLRLDGDEEVLEKVRFCLWEAARDHEKQEVLSHAAVVSWIRLCLIRLSRWLVSRGDADRREQRQMMGEKLLDVYAYIAQHCAEKLTLEEVAAYAGYSKSHFARIFKENYGTSFYAFYMRQKMLLCRQLLGEAGLPVTEVALRAGFGSIATFNRVFRQYEGMTPTAYRQLQQLRRTGGDALEQEAEASGDRNST